ncbi:DUF5054 domain-containing protein [Acutalibacter caecimuris]|uniref:DUF5054 domain-containing protein n=1 Tax=Acutalibacter caecimuris TaxID=3093657 RepID=UPI002AC94396|nr:DUF5054 domain-containing protein [Acutalibacter sp. M00118]
MNNIKKVLVIHKTHLDIGFTDSAQAVLHRYLETFIPGAIATARACNQDGKKNFVWTVGSFLIELYLEQGGDPGLLEQAIRDGVIAWHGLPLTTHTELMDGKLFQYGLSISRRLDQRFGKQTIAAKMTDVPSHTHAMVPYLAKAGIKYLHIGINGSSKMVKLPPLCRLRYGEDEVILDYAALYGASSVCGEVAMEFAHTPDNSGPPSPESVAAEMARLREKYPEAEIVSGTMDEFAQVVLAHREELPVVTEELGDTWIHGVATDPYKSAAYYELLRLRDEWEQTNPAAVDSPAWRAFCRGLLLVVEHSWGRDVKRWLSDWRNWEKEDFYAARQRDHITPEDVMPAGKELREFTLAHEPTFVAGLCSYKKMEDSWEEQRQYVEDAVSALPAPWQAEARRRLAALRPQEAPVCGENTAQREFTAHGWHVRVEEDGSLQVLDKDGRAYENLWLGRLVYQVYSAQTVFDNLERYNRELRYTRVWAEGDFAKPGLDKVPNLPDRTYAYQVDQVEQADGRLRLWLSTGQEAAERFGAPRLAVVTYTFGQELGIELAWYQKDASRIPEGLFFGMNLGYREGEKITLTKLSLPVDPYHVREGGNRKLHVSPAVESGQGVIRSLHAPLVSVGGRHLYDENEDYGSAAEGMYYLLCNNRWGTNFPLWYGENARFAFSVSLQ